VQDVRDRRSKTEPTVSVVLPVFSASAYVAKAIDSILTQTLTDFELIVVDDGSTDGSTQTVERIALSDQRVVVLTQEHAGLVAALQKGVAVSRGRYIARMDADDISLPSRLEAQAGLLDSNPAVDVASCRVEFWSAVPLGTGTERYAKWVNSLLSPEEIARDIFVESPIPHPSVMMRAEALERAGGYQDHGWPEDYDLWLRMHLSGSRFAKVPETLLKWSVRDDSLCRTDERYSIEKFRECKLHYLSRSHLKDRHEVLVWGAGRVGKPWVRMLKQAGFDVPCIVDIDPRKIGKTIHGAKVISPDDMPPAGKYVLLVAVGAPGARELIREDLDKKRYRETADFVCVA
jgi:glycosyltransferase involved in cell wall biosynthesis